jgi:hypothetical protein
MIIDMNVKILICGLSIIVTQTSCDAWNKNHKIDNSIVTDSSIVTEKSTVIENDTVLVDKQKSIDIFYRNFMDESYFNPKEDVSVWAKKYLTDHCISKLKEIYDEMYDTEEEFYIAEWMFRLGAEEEEKLQTGENMHVVHDKEDWYVIHFGKGTVTKKNSYKVKIIRENDTYKIDDVINESINI